MPSDQATGYSSSLSFDEAFHDALKNLPKHDPKHPDETTGITVESIGAELGGYAGHRRLKVQISAVYT